MKQIHRGRALVIIVTVISLVLSFALTAWNSSQLYAIGSSSEATYALVQGMFRFALTCLLFLFVYKGHRWARLIALILFGISALISVIAIFTSSLSMLITAIPYILSFVLLLSPSVTTYQNYTKNGVPEATGTSAD